MDEDEPISRQGRGHSAWPLLFLAALGMLIAVVSFGVGMLAERAVFAGGSVFERAREIGGLDADAEPGGEAAFPRLAEVERLIEDEYFFRPTASEALATFTAELERDAVAGMAAVAATPGASIDAYHQQLEYAAIRGMTEGLEDPHTAFLEPVEHAPVAEQMSGEYEGIGVWVDYPNGVLTVVAPIPGSPAEAAGLRPDDVIEAADGTPLVGVSKDEALKLIRGPAGTSVRLTIRRPGEAEPLTVDVERRAITMPAVSYHPAGDGRVAWIKVTIFGDKTTGQLDAALKRAKEEEVAGIVLDLRQNGGGWVTSAREMIGRFVPADRGPAFYEDTDPADDGELDDQSIIGGGEEVFDLPVVVLVDGGTASASEIVAGALRVYRQAKLVGTPTFGKGSVQRVHDFEDGSSVRITFAQWLTPDKEPIPEEGLMPDVTVELPEGLPNGADPQLDRAVELILGEGS